MAGRLVVLLLALAGGVRADDLDALFDPANPQFGLRTLSGVQFRELPRKDQLVAKGVDPRLWKAPPPAAGALRQENANRDALFAGFAYHDRLEAKRRAFLQLSRRVPEERLVKLVARMELLEPQPFVQGYYPRTKGMNRETTSKGKTLLHPLLALRHSERQFHAWFADELGRRIGEQSRRELALRLLDRELAGPTPLRRRWAARILSRVPDPAARRALERALAREKDPETQAAIVTARGEIGGARLKDLLVLWTIHPSFAVRVAAFRVCARYRHHGLLRDALDREKGRLLDDLSGILGVEAAGEVDFYGIRTRSRRIAFVIDTSGSMAFPMDGKGGKREPRYWRTKREINRTLRLLPRHVQFNIYLFAGEVAPWARGLVAATKEHTESAIAFLEQHKPYGGTNLFAAVLAGLQSGADTVFLLSDGEPSIGTPLLDPALIVEEMGSRNAHGRVVIHTVGLSRDQNAALLVNLAHRSGGRYVADR